MRRFVLFFSLAAAAVVLGLVALAPETAFATHVRLVAKIDRAQAASTCPGAGPGTGLGIVDYDTTTNMLSWDITFSGMSGAPTVAHFHGPAAAGADAGVQVTIGDLTSPSVGSIAITEAQEGQLMSGLWYINYHSAMCTGGEIRGQVLVSAVGGVAELPDAPASPLQQPENDSGANVGFIAGITAAAVATFGVIATGAWLARKRILS